jgi:hypothetical protein
MAIEDRGDSRRVVGDVYGVHYSRAVWWVEPQNHRVHGFEGLSPKPGGGSEEEWEQHVVKS